MLAALGAKIQDIPQDEWNALNSTVGGRLQIAAPFARPCFSEASPGVSGTFDALECAQVQANHGNAGMSSI